MQPSGHRLRDIEHHPLLTDNDNYDSASSSSSETDMADRVWFIRDGCGMVCAVMTWLLVVYADFVVTFVMLLPSKDFWYSVVNGVLFNCLAVLALSSHLRTMLTDPGAVPKGNATKEYMESLQLKPGEVIYKCPKCCCIKPERAHHCSICKRCIRKMDHRLTILTLGMSRGHPRVELLLSHEESQHSSAGSPAGPSPAHPLTRKKGFHRDSALEASDTQH